MSKTIDKCPICGNPVGQYHEVTFDKPFIHNIPFDGLQIYGAYTAPKETICYQDNFLHFAFYDADGNLTDHRLVKLGVEQPATQSPSEEYMDGLEEEDEWEEDWEPNDDEDNDDEEFPNGSLDY